MITNSLSYNLFCSLVLPMDVGEGSLGVLEVEGGLVLLILHALQLLLNKESRTTTLKGDRSSAYLL